MARQLPAVAPNHCDFSSLEPLGTRGAGPRHAGRLVPCMGTHLVGSDNPASNRPTSPPVHEAALCFPHHAVLWAGVALGVVFVSAALLSTSQARRRRHGDRARCSVRVSRRRWRRPPMLQSRGLTLGSFASYAEEAPDSWARGEPTSLRSWSAPGSSADPPGPPHSDPLGEVLRRISSTGSERHRRAVASQARPPASFRAGQPRRLASSGSRSSSLMTTRRAGWPRGSPALTSRGVLRNKIRWDDRAYDAHIFSFVPSDFA